MDSQTMLLVATIVSAIATFFLVIGTAIYTFYTYRMSKATQAQLRATIAQFQQSRRPALWLEKHNTLIDLATNNPIGLHLYFNNGGATPAQAHIEEAVFIDQKGTKTILPLRNSELCVFPNSQNRYLKLLFTPAQAMQADASQTAHIHLKISYWSVVDSQKKNIYVYEETYLFDLVNHQYDSLDIRLT